MDTRLIWLALGGFVGSCEGFLIGALLPTVADDFGVTIGQVSGIAFFYSFGYAIGTPVLSALLGNMDRRTLVTLAEAGVCLVCLLMALSPTIIVLTVLRLLLSLTAGVFTSNAVATAATITDPAHRGRAIGFVTSGQSFALIAGVPAFAFLAAHFGWRANYFIISGLALVAVIGLRFGLPAGIPNVKLSLGARLSVLRERAVRMTLLSTFLFMTGSYVGVIFVGPIIASIAGDRTMLPAILLANGIGAFIGSNFGGRAADRYGAMKTALVLCGLQALSLIGFALATTMGASAGLWMMAAATFIGGVSGWAFWAAQSSLISGMAKSSVNLAVALNFSALSLGVALLSLLGGWIIDRAGAGSLALAGAVFILLATVTLLYVRNLVAVPPAPSQVADQR